MNTLSKEKYSIQRKYIDVWIKNHPDKPLVDEVSYMALATGVPIIITIEFVMEIVGRVKELQELQERLMKFYKIDAVV